MSCACLSRPRVCGICWCKLCRTVSLVQILCANYPTRRSGLPSWNIYTCLNIGVAYLQQDRCSSVAARGPDIVFNSRCIPLNGSSLCPKSAMCYLHLGILKQRHTHLVASSFASAFLLQSLAHFRKHGLGLLLVIWTPEVLFKSLHKVRRLLLDLETKHLSHAHDQPEKHTHKTAAWRKVGSTHTITHAKEPKPVAKNMFAV